MADIANLRVLHLALGRRKSCKQYDFGVIYDPRNLNKAFFRPSDWFDGSTERDHSEFAIIPTDLSPEELVNKIGWSADLQVAQYGIMAMFIIDRAFTPGLLEDLRENPNQYLPTPPQTLDSQQAVTIYCRSLFQKMGPRNIARFWGR